MIVMRKIFSQRDIPFLGPTASVGGFYLGPIYYWMAAPFLLISVFDPVGPAYMVAILGVLTTFILFRFIKDTIGFWPAFLTGLIYAVDPLILRYSRSSWNPNPLPLFALLLFYFIYLAIVRKKLRYFLFSGACLGIAVQLHYLAIILAALAALAVLLNIKIKDLLKAVSLAAFGFLITFSPFLLFELRNNFPNFHTIFQFVTRGTTVRYNETNIIANVFNLGNAFMEELTRSRNNILTKITFLVLTFSGIFVIVRQYRYFDKKVFLTISLIWFFGGLLFLRLYTGQIHDYYYGFMFPAPFLLFAIFLSILWNKTFLKITALILTAFIFVYFAFNGYFRTPPNRQIDQTKDIANIVMQNAANSPYNFALISDNNSDHAYRYFLETGGKKPTELEELVTGQLLVICESKVCEPLGNSSWEIAGFGRAEIERVWNLENYGIKIYRLTHWPGTPSPEGKPAQKGG